MFDNLVEEYRNIKQDLVDRVKVSIGDLFKEAFDAYPDIKLIRWHQYTPYFNDGDTCEFYVNEFYVSNSLEVNEYGEFEDMELESDPTIFVKEVDEYPLIVKIETFAQTDIGNEVFLEIFGDHQYISVTREGIDAEWFEHD